jgi:hypothetical protein
LHLEHPVVQRLLSRLRSQGFQHNDIARACILPTDEKIPRVVLLGRVIVYGKGAARLHEEVVTVSARWRTVETRGDSLQPYKEGSAKETFILMEEALAKCNPARVNEKRLKDIGAAAERDVVEMRVFLEKEAQETAADAIQKLKNRGELEAKNLRTIIEAQIKRVRETADKPFTQSLFGDWSPLEIRQFETDKKYWAQRLAKLQTELETEPARIAGLYDVAHVRTVPLGLVYLVPGEQ